MSRKFKVVPVMYAASGDVYTLKLQNTEALAGLLSDGWSVMRTDVLPGLGGKASTRWSRTYAMSHHSRRQSSTSSVRRRNDARHQS